MLYFPAAGVQQWQWVPGRRVSVAARTRLYRMTLLESCGWPKNAVVSTALIGRATVYLGRPEKGVNFGPHPPSHKKEHPEVKEGDCWLSDTRGSPILHCVLPF